MIGLRIIVVINLTRSISQRIDDIKVEIEKLRIRRDQLTKLIEFYYSQIKILENNDKE